MPDASRILKASACGWLRYFGGVFRQTIFVFFGLDIPQPASFATLKMKYSMLRLSSTYAERMVVFHGELFG